MEGAMASYFIVLLILLAHPHKGDCNCGDSSWTLYKDEKCFKIIDQSVTREQADVICAEEVGSSTSIQSSLSVRTAEEQSFLTKFVFEDSRVADNIWLGATRLSNGSYKWTDDTNFEYTNWAEGNPSNDPEKPCVQMNSHLSKIDDGLWTDASCVKRNLVVCQKQQSLPLEELMRILMETRQQLTEIGQKLTVVEQELTDVGQQLTAVTSNPVPVGFIYVEFPDRPDPQQLWPNVIWQDVTTTYAGLFFRAGGGDSAAFNTTQMDSSPRIIAARTTTNNLDTSISIEPNGDYSTGLETGATYESDFRYSLGVEFLQSSGEVRPKNTALDTRPIIIISVATYLHIYVIQINN